MRTTNRPPAASLLRATLLACLAASFAATASAQPAFTPLSDLPGGDVFSKATGVSDDGRFVVGGSATDLPGLTPIRWDGTTPTTLPLPAGFTLGAEMNDIAGNGQAAVGMGNFQGRFVGVRWDNNDNPTITGDFAAPNWSSANAINYDGNVITGFGDLSLFPGDSEMFRWTPIHGEQPLGGLPGAPVNSNGTGVSNDGKTLAGFAFDFTGPKPVRWTESSGFEVMPAPPGGSGNGVAIGISHDGTTLLGEAETTTLERLPAAFADSGSLILGSPPAPYTTGTAIASNADGSVVIGNWRISPFSDELESEAFIWDAANGTRLLADALLSEYQLDVSGWTLNQITDITPDGTTMVGYGLNPTGAFEAFKIVVPEPATATALLLIGASIGLFRRPIRRTRRL